MRSIDGSSFTPWEKAFYPRALLSDYAFSLCGGPCAGLLAVEDAAMLREAVRICIHQNIPYIALGGISNVLISDTGYDGVVLLNRKGHISHQTKPDGTVLLTVDSGTPMAAVVRYCTEAGLSGFEWAAGLPGTVGGAVYGNAGAFGSEIADIFENAVLIGSDGAERKIDKDGMEFAYRCSKLKQKKDSGTLLTAEFTVVPGNRESILALGRKYREIRKEKQPFGEPSLGSVFKNPEGESAGKLIQAAGLKGMSIGKATVSMKHGNFITTEKGARSSDYFDLVLTVQKTVGKQFGIFLEPEIEFIGFASA